MMDTRLKLIMAATEYDRKEEKKPNHNRYALPQYFEAINDVMEMIESGKTLRVAITACFCGRIATALLKAVGESAYTLADDINARS